MILKDSTHGTTPFHDTSLLAPDIPTRRTPWFMQALWALALLVVVGIAYSFWRISSVASPRLEVPPSQSTDNATPR